MKCDMINEFRVETTLLRKYNQFLEGHVFLRRISSEEVFEERVHITQELHLEVNTSLLILKSREDPVHT